MRKSREEKTAKKAMHMIGLGPISHHSVDFFYNATADHTLAKELAVNEFLVEYLQFSQEEIDEFGVLETMTSKEKDIMYVTMANHDAIKDIQRRVAEVRLDEIATRTYIPPQYWSRYSALNAYCKELRENNPDIKTIIRFTETDLEVLTKDKSREEPYRVTPMEDIEAKITIPKYDHKLTWRKRSDKPVRSQPTPVRGRIIPPSLRQTQTTRPRSEDTELDKTVKRSRNCDLERMSTD